MHSAESAASAAAALVGMREMPPLTATLHSVVDMDQHDAAPIWHEHRQYVGSREPTSPPRASSPASSLLLGNVLGLAVADCGAHANAVAMESRAPQLWHVHADVEFQTLPDDHTLLVRGQGRVLAYFAKDKDSTNGIGVHVSIPKGALRLGDRIILIATVIDAATHEPVPCEAITFRDSAGRRLPGIYPVLHPDALDFWGCVHVWHPKKPSIARGRRYTRYQLVIQGVWSYADSRTAAFTSEPSYPWVWQVKVSPCTPFAHMMQDTAASGSDDAASQCESTAVHAGAKRASDSDVERPVSVPAPAAPEEELQTAIDSLRRVKPRLCTNLAARVDLALGALTLN